MDDRYRFGSRKDGKKDFVISTDKEGKLVITFTHTNRSRIIDLNQFVGKQYDYNTILISIFQDYPTPATFEIKKSAKRAISNQAKKNQEC